MVSKRDLFYLHNDGDENEADPFGIKTTIYK